MRIIKWQQTEKQSDAWDYLLDSTTTELLFGGGAGGGKTYLGCAWLISMCGTYAGSRWVMGRAVLKRLKETTLATFFDVCSEWEIKQGVDFTYNENMGLIKWSNGSEILLKDLAYMPSDPNYDALGSLEISGGFVDETSEVPFKAVDVLKTRIRYKLDEFGIPPKMLLTCNPAKNWLYPEFYRPSKEGKLPPYRKFVQSLVTDNPFISPKYIENLKKIRDRAIKERLLFGNWEYDDDPSALFSFDSIQDLFTNKGKGELKYISGDVARKGRDKMPIGYWEGLQLKKIYEIPQDIKSDTVKAAEFVQKIADEHQVRKSSIILDEDGVGGGIVDILGCRGFINGGSAFQPLESKFDETKKQNFANLKAQCYYKLADLADKGEIGVNATPDQQTAIVEELEQIKRKNLDKDNKILIVGKDEIREHIGRSPDYADMIMMRMYFEVTKREARVRVL